MNPSPNNSTHTISKTGYCIFFTFFRMPSGLIPICNFQGFIPLAFPSRDKKVIPAVCELRTCFGSEDLGGHNPSSMIYEWSWEVSLRERALKVNNSHVIGNSLVVFLYVRLSSRQPWDDITAITQPESSVFSCFF